MAQADPTRIQVRRVLLITLVLNLLVAVGKIVLGFVSGALAITADGFHSLTDGTGNVAGLIANHYAAQPPDENHPYGHRRFETMGALLIGALLLLTALEMGRGVLDRLSNPEPPVLSTVTFVVMGTTLLINIGVSRYQIREGKRLQSEILLADARNTHADVYVTSSVILSTALVMLTGWAWLDLVAALAVCGLIARAAWQILRETGRVLVDTAPYTPEQIVSLLHGVPQVIEIVRARSRGPLDAALIDIDVKVAPELTAVQTNAIAYAIRQRLNSQLSGLAEVEVHFAPHKPSAGDPALTARAYADALGLATHEVQVGQDRSGTVLEMHVEVPPGQTLQEAHEAVSQLESDLKRRLVHIDRVVTHIEPAQPAPPVAADAELNAEAQALEAEARALLTAQQPDVHWHEFRARPTEEGCALTLHAALPSALSIEEAHRIAEDAETALRAALPRLSRVTIHTEPHD